MISEFDKLKHWWSPTTGTPDYFCNCESGKWKNSQVEASGNFIGHQEPRSGSCYAGFIVYQSSASIYAEYLETKLIAPMEKGKQYTVSFYLSVADYCKYQIDSAIGIYFSGDKVAYSTPNRINAKPQVSSKGKLENSADGWFGISAVYTAKGGEKYMVIGMFNKAKARTRKYEKQKNVSAPKYAYYYIDDVSVYEIKEKTENKKKIPPVVTETLEVNKSYILKNLNFETGSAVIQASSFEELDKVVAYFLKNDSLKIEIRGHTDNTGDEKSNQKLSEERARAVADYLVSKGMAANRIKYKGYGSAMPYASNETEEGKAQNRRVEFIISN
ncbi:MAG: OmpA family protein [Bacteroidota bacterium]